MERNGVFKPWYAQKLCSIAQNKLRVNVIEVLNDFRQSFERFFLKFRANFAEASRPPYNNLVRT